MARERMVTRTVVTHEVSFKMFNLETMELEDKVLSFGVNVDIKNDNKGLSILNERLTSDGVNGKACMILSITDVEELYGMTEIEFLKHAKKLPPRTVNDEN